MPRVRRQASGVNQIEGGERKGKSMKWNRGKGTGWKYKARDTTGTIFFILPKFQLQSMWEGGEGRERGNIANRTTKASGTGQRDNKQQDS